MGAAAIEWFVVSFAQYKLFEEEENQIIKSETENIVN